MIATRRRLTDRALSCAPPVCPEDTPAGGRRCYHPTGRPPAPGPGRLRGGGASAAAPCWAAWRLRREPPAGGSDLPGVAPRLPDPGPPVPIRHVLRYFE